MRSNLFRIFCVAIMLFPVLALAAGTPPDLNNISLVNEDDPARPYHLVDGRMTGDHLDIRVLKKAACDFDGDGLIDGVVITLENYGGSGNFRVLNLLVNRRGRLVNTDRIQLGDRVRVEDLRVGDSGKVEIDLLDRASGAPLAAAPKLKKRLVFQVEKEKLVPVPAPAGSKK